MAAVTPTNNVVKFTADGDTLTTSGKVRCKGARLVAAAANATAKLKVLNNAGAVICSMSCVANYDTECGITLWIDGGVVYLTLTGAGAEVFLYLE